MIKTGMRISKPTKIIKGRSVLEIQNYVPYLLVATNNALSRSASKLYLKTFGVGIVEWRVMAMLAIEPEIPAMRICDVISLDKAATSRALVQLREAGYVEFKASTRDPRKKIWWLNTNGNDLHDKILDIALDREKQLLNEVNPDDLEIFLKVMRQMRQNVEKIL